MASWKGVNETANSDSHFDRRRRTDHLPNPSHYRNHHNHASSDSNTFHNTDHRRCNCVVPDWQPSVRRDSFLGHRGHPVDRETLDAH